MAYIEQGSYHRFSDNSTSFRVVRDDGYINITYVPRIYEIMRLVMDNNHSVYWWNSADGSTCKRMLVTLMLLGFEV